MMPNWQFPQSTRQDRPLHKMTRKTVRQPSAPWFLGQSYPTAMRRFQHDAGPHDDARRSNFVLANPPFNVNAVGEERLKDSVGPGCRFPFGLPHTDNANGHLCFFDITAPTLPSGFPPGLAARW